MIYKKWKDGVYDQAIKDGCFKEKIISYCKIYHVYIQHRAVGRNYIEACELAADEIGASVSSVKRAIAEVI